MNEQVKQTQIVIRLARRYGATEAEIERYIERREALETPDAYEPLLAVAED